MIRRNGLLLGCLLFACQHQWVGQANAIRCDEELDDGSVKAAAVALVRGKVATTFRPAGSSSYYSGPTVGAVAIRRIAVIGERHSGTNFMSRLLATNLEAGRYEFGDFFSLDRTRSEPTHPKHCYQAALPGEAPLLALGQLQRNRFADALAVVMLRNPYDWARSMHSQCWCADRAAIGNGTFESLVTSKWKDNCPKPWLGERKAGSCTNIMACRAAKYLNYFNMSHWAPNVEFVRHEDVLTPRDSTAWLERLVAKYHLKTSGPDILANTKYKDWNKRRFAHTTAIKTSLWFNRQQLTQNSTLRSMVALVNRQMDVMVESMAGYSPIPLPVDKGA